MPSPWPTPPAKRRGRTLLKVLTVAVVVVLALFAALVALGLVVQNRDGRNRYATPQDPCALIPLDRLDGWAGSAEKGSAARSGRTVCEYQLAGTGATPNQLTLTLEVADHVGDSFRSTRAMMKTLPAGDFHEVAGLGRQAYTHSLVTGQGIIQTMSLLDGNLVLTAKFTGFSDRAWVQADLEDHLVTTLRGALSATPRASEASATRGATSGPGLDPNDPCAYVTEADVKDWLGAVTSSIPKTASQVAPPAKGCFLMMSGRNSKTGLDALSHEYVVGDGATAWYDGQVGRWASIGKPVSGVGSRAFAYDVPGYRDEVVNLTMFVQDGERAVALTVLADDPKLSHEAARERLISLAKTMLTRLPRAE